MTHIVSQCQSATEPLTGEGSNIEYLVREAPVEGWIYKAVSEQYVFEEAV